MSTFALIQNSRTKNAHNPHYVSLIALHLTQNNWPHWRRSWRLLAFVMTLIAVNPAAKGDVNIEDRLIEIENMIRKQTEMFNRRHVFRI